MRSCKEGHTSMNYGRLVILLFLVLFPSFAFTQKNTGAIEGTVKDNENRPIPGVSITASSSSLIGGSTKTFSGTDGFYRFPVLPSGTYEVQAELSGFQNVTQKELRIFVGKTLTVDFQLELQTVKETVEVSKKPSLIDVTTTEVAVTVPPEIINNLPKQNIQKLFALTPGVGDDLIAYGADGAKAIHAMVDGVTAGNPRGREVVFLDYDYNWIDEFQVTGIGAPAEYGRFTGVVGNFTTRSGSNRFHGLFETFFQNEDLTSSNVPDPGPETPFKTFDISAQVGGPILKDRLWFFAGLQHPHLENSAPGSEVSTNIETKFITKLTYKWNDNNSLHGLVNSNVGSEEQGAGPQLLPEATTKIRNVQSSWNVSWFSVITPQSNFEGRFGGFRSHFYDVEDRPDVPGHTDLGTGVISVNNITRYDETEARVQMNGALSHYAADFLLGSHDFRFGVQYENSDAFFVGYAGILYLDYFGAPYMRYNISGREFDGTNESTGFYAQDEWNLTDRVNLSVGVRWDHNRGTTDRGVVFATDPVAPRIGMVWILDRDNQTVIKAHYGDYYEALLNRNYSFLSDENVLQITELFNPANGQWEEIRRFHEVYLGDKSLKQPVVRQFTLGIDRVITGDIPVGVHYIYRRFGNFVEDISLSEFEPLPFVNPITGETITVYNRLNPDPVFFFTNPAGLKRRYNGIQFTASKYLFKNLSVMGSFVYSRLTGNAPGDNRFGGANTQFLDTPNSLINFPGRLENDPTIAWKIVGTYTLPLGFNTGWYLRHESGDTWTATVDPKLPCCRRVRIFGEPAGSRRLPSQTLLDMRVEKQFPFYGGQLRFAIDIFNVFNSDYPLRVQDRFEAPDFGKPFVFIEPRKLRVGIRYTF